MAQKVVRKKCIAAEVPYSDFLALIKQISKRIHISNWILLNKYLAPAQTDPQYQVKVIFAEYF
jgi:hypothetical protein